MFDKTAHPESAVARDGDLAARAAARNGNGESAFFRFEPAAKVCRRRKGTPDRRCGDRRKPVAADRFIDESGRIEHGERDISPCDPATDGAYFFRHIKFSRSLSSFSSPRCPSTRIGEKPAPESAADTSSSSWIYCV